MIVGRSTVIGLQVQHSQMQVGRNCFADRVRGRGSASVLLPHSGHRESAASQGHPATRGSSPARTTAFCAAGTADISDVHVILRAKHRQQSPVAWVFRGKGCRLLIGIQGMDQISQLCMRLPHRNQPGWVIRLHRRGSLELGQGLRGNCRYADSTARASRAQWRNPG